MEPVDEDKFNSLSSPPQPPVDDTSDTEKPVANMHQGQDSEGGCGDVSQYPETVLPVDEKEAVQDGSETVRPVQEVEKFSDFEDKDKGIETEEVGRSTEGNTNPVPVEGRIEEVEVKAVDVVEELTVAGEVESTEMGNAGGEVAMEEGPADEAAGVAEKLENMGTELKEEVALVSAGEKDEDADDKGKTDLKEELADVASYQKNEYSGLTQELGNMRDEELVREEAVDDEDAGMPEQFENMGNEELKEEAVDGVEDSVLDGNTEIEPKPNLTEGLEAVGNAEEELVLGRKVEANENIDEAEETKQSNVNVPEDAKMFVVDEANGIEEMEEGKVENRECFDLPEETEGAEQDKLTDKAEETEEAEQDKLTDNTEETEVAEESGDVNERDKIGDAEMADREEEREKEEEMESAEVGEETEMAEEGEKMKEAEEMEMAEETEGAEEGVSRSAGKRKRGKSAKAPSKPSSRRKSEEDVCFICFDGGNLVLCDRRGCPKAYHPSCVNRDEAFFQTKGRWNCGWHLCSNCQKNAYYMCYTCTFSLCKGCIKDAVFFCVRGNKGFCETCMKTVTMIEKSEQGNTDTVDFNDKSSWEYLFKDYWTDLKGRLALTSEEIAQAKIPLKGIDLQSGKQGLSEDLHDANNDGGSGSDSSSGDAEPTASKRRKASKRLKSRAKGRGSQRVSTLTEGDYEDGSVEWASKELLKFVAHMKNGDKSVCSQFDVQALLLEYIKRNKLRDPRRKSQIICDSRLESLFGKPCVGHFEMLKLLESHFLLKEDSQGDDLQGSVVDNESNQLETDGSPSMKMSKDKKRKSRKKGRGLQSNLDDYAAIDLHNINLIYLRRSLLENLLEDTETFHEKVVGSFVRIRISGNAQKQDLYRLVQVVGTSKAGEPYKVGKKMTEYVLEILNLNKTELVSIDIISNQDFTEDECKRLRQSIKCGLIKWLTVGDIQEKALALQAVRVEDLLESEVTRLSHLRDRASDLGKRKDLRECVEKLQLLKSPEERQRRLVEIPEIHADPNMDPSIESEEDEDEADDKRQESFLRPRGSAFSRRGREPVSPVKGGFASNDSWSGIKNFSSSNRGLSRSMSNKGFSNKADDAVKADEMLNENLWSHGREKEPQVSQTWEKSKTASNSEPPSTHSLLTSETVPRGMSEMSPTHPSIGVAQSALKINESDKIWHYRDPSGKIQGPFSMVQLRKWNNTGYFPTDLRIWRTTEKQDDSIILTNALNGNFQKETSSIENSSLKTQMIPEPHASPSLLGRAGESWKSQPEIGNSAGQGASSMVSVPNNSTDRWGPESSLPSPTPARTATGATKGQLYESKWSPTPTQPADNGTGASPFSRGSRDLQHPGAIRESGPLLHTSLSSSAVINVSHDAQMHSQSEVPNDSLRGQVNSHLHHGPDSSGGTANATIDMRGLQNLVQPITGNKPLAGTLGWGPATVSKPEMNPSNTLAWSRSQSWGNTSSQKQESDNSMSMPAQPNAYGNWSNALASVPNSTPSFSTGNPTGISPVPGPSSTVPSGPWRAPVPGQSNVPPSVLSNMPWGAGVADNKSGAQRQGAENQVTGWGPIPGNTSVGWGGPVPTNPNQGWVAPGQGPAPGNTNMGWGTPTQGQVPGNTNSGWVGPVAAQMPGNAYQAWVPTAQGSAQMNVNPAWGAPSHGPSPANANPSWGAHGGNEKSKGPGDRFSGQRDTGSQGRDSGYGENKPWNRQSSFGNRGGDSSRPPYKGQRICKYHESGHCKKGAQCDYLHT